MAKGGSCDTCCYLMYDDDLEEYVCDVNMDEDDYGRLVQSHFKECPYYKDGDEYKVVRHQM
ncbi:MAG: DUF6472 family protein [Eubacterium sp.]|nr:DUF6472 family protein [Eubacterium sp.]SEF54474.1 hypothetical protein SAMN04487934_101527 [Eubacterium ruminantium]